MPKPIPSSTLRSLAFGAPHDGQEAPSQPRQGVTASRPCQGRKIVWLALALALVVLWQGGQALLEAAIAALTPRIGQEP